MAPEPERERGEPAVTKLTWMTMMTTPREIWEIFWDLSIQINTILEVALKATI